MKKLNSSDFIEKFRKVHGDRYDYSAFQYLDSNTKVKIICKNHGPYETLPYNHFTHHCYECSKITVLRKNSNSKEKFIIKARKIHGEKYDYSMVVKPLDRNKIKIICKIHGQFSLSAGHHLAGRGCKKCTRENIRFLAMNEFIKKANIIHNNKYSYERINYKGDDKKLFVTCLDHGDFYIQGRNHLKGRGCSTCKVTKASFKEIAWLDSMGIKREYFQKQIKFNDKYFLVDAYDPDTNTIYEFYGDYWHGNPKKYKADEINGKKNVTFGECYNKTIEIENILKSLGYSIVTIWESDFEIK
jgi:hypothetical protein